MKHSTPPYRTAVALAAAAALSACIHSAPPQGLATVRILAINDFHGNLEAPRNGYSGPDPADLSRQIRTPAGGAARLATALEALAGERPGASIIVGAGDLVGASPLLSSLFNDEPTILSLSAMGLALSAVGNHEFDEGGAELRRLQTGGCHPKTGCAGPSAFKGAGFSYLAASTIDTTTGATFFPPYAIRTLDGVRVGFIGLTLEGTSGLIAPSAAENLSFRDEADTINAYVPELKTQGVETIVVLIHEGGMPGQGTEACPGLSGPIVDILGRIDPDVDLIVSGHTHQAYVCRIGGRLLTSAHQYGMMLTDIQLTIDRATGDVVDSEARNLVVRHDAYAESAGQLALIDSYRQLAEPLMNRPVGMIAADLLRTPNAAGESILGGVIADAMLEAAGRGGADIAFMNPGGIRGDIARRPDGQATYGDLFAAQPFGNTLVALTLSGREIETLLNQQFTQNPQRILQISEGFAYTWTEDAAGARAVVPGSLRLRGAPVDPDATYRIVTNNYLAEGGDGFVLFRQGRDPRQIGGDIEALEAFIASRSPLQATNGERIRRSP
jgi:5'-nucleotidase